MSLDIFKSIKISLLNCFQGTLLHPIHLNLYYLDKRKSRITSKTAKERITFITEGSM